MKLFFRISVSCCLLLSVVSHYKRKDLSSLGSLLEEVQSEPIQTATKQEGFIFEYRGRDYEIEPVADYELYGLVVTHNDIHAFSDIYHDEDSVDFKDICVIWGDNAKNSAYKEVTFWSEPWTCWSRWNHGEAIGFSIRDLSNNHLLSASKSVRQTIENMQVGDQIYLRGYLVNYWESSQAESVRRSSTSREDEGNGACEVLFVEEAKILVSGPTFWRYINYWSKRIALVLMVFWIAFFLKDAYRPMLDKAPEQ